MKKYEKILIATDFSQSSDFALKFAKNFQKHNPAATITLVHISDASRVWDFPGSSQQVRDLLGKFQDELNFSLKTKMSEQQSRCGVNFINQIIFGDAYSELMKLLEETSQDLLIMGHRGERSLFPIGSLAKKMISSSPIPVLITNNDLPINKVGCLLDLSSLSPSVIEEGHNIAKIYNAHLSYFSSIADLSSKAIAAIPFAITSYSFDEDERIDIIQKAKEVVMKAVGNVNEEDIIIEISKDDTSVALSEILDERNIDLAVLAKHNRGPLEKFFMGSVSKGFIDYFKGNTLILPGGKK